MNVNRREFLKSSLGMAAAASWASYPNPTTNKVYRVAVIGHTNRGNYGHGLDTLWKNIPECKVIAVADQVEEGLTKAKQRLGNIPGYSNYVQMLKDTKPDIVSIAPRHIDQHYTMVLASAEAGVKGIYLEKPFCRNLMEAQQIVDLCRAKNIKLALAHRNRYHPALAKAQQIIQEGGIGRVMEVRGRGKEDHRGGALDLWVLGSHVLNLVPLFTGPFLSCNALLYQDGHVVTQKNLYEGDEGVGIIGGNRLHARFETEKGIPFFFDSIQNGGVKEGNFGFQVLGNKGVVDVRIDTEPLIHFWPLNPYFPKKQLEEWEPITSAGLGKEEPIKSIDIEIAGHRAAVRDLLKAIEKDHTPLCNEIEGYATVEAIMGVFESHRRGGQRVPFPLTVMENPLSKL